VNSEGRGPAWANSLFEDNAEFGLGIKLATDKKREMAIRLLKELREEVGTNWLTLFLQMPRMMKPG
jgi:pyruvate-ferredoxin/flavodoxin oxidoreductase